jgi:hypothetical protein
MSRRQKIFAVVLLAIFMGLLIGFIGYKVYQSRKLPIEIIEHGEERATEKMSLEEATKRIVDIKSSSTGNNLKPEDIVRDLNGNKKTTNRTSSFDYEAYDREQKGFEDIANQILKGSNGSKDIGDN